MQRVRAKKRKSEGVSCSALEKTQRRNISTKKFLPFVFLLRSSGHTYEFCKPTATQVLQTPPATLIKASS